MLYLMYISYKIILLKAIQICVTMRFITYIQVPAMKCRLLLMILFIMCKLFNPSVFDKKRLYTVGIIYVYLIFMRILILYSVCF